MFSLFHDNINYDFMRVTLNENLLRDAYTNIV